MADLIQVSCPGCNAIFELPPELGGELGECTECSAIFEIPRVEAIQEGAVQKTDTGSVKVEKKSPDGATNTVKLSRTSIGMVPQVKDSFQFGVVNKSPTSTQTGTRTSSTLGTKKSFTKPPSSTSTVSKTKTSMQKSAHSKKKAWWEYLLFWKK
ncbi:MAG: hypothetical protein A2X49_01755 [Lentisphaerae bacterium GWF2_52_8]|nr:MAG: hypothetical protein A2X49_01755 [Lentisphaerae bacterium GWF2_52_8]